MKSNGQQSKRTTRVPGARNAATRPLAVTRVGKLPPKTALAISGTSLKVYRYTYSTGPFCLPMNTHSLDWGLLNNDTTVQKARVTVFKCNLGAVKTAEPPGPLEVTLHPGEVTHNANAACGGFYYEIEIECNSQLLFPYAAAWPGTIGNPIAGSVVKPAEFIRKLG